MSKEITLQEIFVSTYSYIKFNRIILAGFFLAGLIIGGIRYFLVPPLYESSLTAVSAIDREIEFENHPEHRRTIYSSELAANKIMTYQKALENGNYNYLSKELNISLDSIKMLSSVSVNFLYPIEGTPHEEYVRAIDFLEITVEVTGNGILPKLEKAFVKSLQNDPFLSEKAKDLRQTTQQIITEIDREIEKIDARLEQTSKGSSNFTGRTHKSLHSEKIDLLRLKSKYTNYLNDYTPFKVLTGFVPSNKNKNGALKNLGLFGVALLVLGFGFVFLRDVAKMAARENKK